MSIVKTLDIFCDFTGCHDWVNGESGYRVEARGARRTVALRRQGWFLSASGDFCPEHAQMTGRKPTRVVLSDRERERLANYVAIEDVR